MPIQLMSDEDRITVTDADLMGGNGDTDTSYTLRPLTHDVYKRVGKQHTRTAPNRQTRQMESRIDDQVAVMEDLIDYALVGWTGVLWNGEPAPCEREIKLRLDGVRRTALLERAGMNQIVAAEADRQSSFR